MTESEAASERGRERRALRREFEPERELERLDKRHTRAAKFKMLTIHVSITDELLAAVDARRQLMNFGRGQTRSAFLEYVLRMYLQKGRAAREFQHGLEARTPPAAGEDLSGR